MINSTLRSYTLGLGVSTSLFAGCGSSSATVGSLPQTQELVTRIDELGSWMSPGASSNDLLYVAGSKSESRVYVFTYPGGVHVGTLGGLANPSAVCVNAVQNVWISTLRPNEMLLYAHGKAKPRAKLANNYGDAVSCAVDPKTGNLAVANLFGAGGYGSNVIVYPNAQGSPAVYSVPNFLYVWGCSYDASGNLFASGEVYNSSTHVAELPSGGSAFEDLNLSETLEDTATGLQWDGTYLDIALNTEVYQLSISGSQATVKNTFSLLDADPEWAFNFFVDGNTIISHVEPRLGAVGLWNFPSGGYPSKIIPNAHGEKSGYDENEVVVSKATDK